MAQPDDFGVSAADLQRFSRKWRVRTLSVFGSAARGELRRDSDIDLVVDFEDGARWDLFDLADMRTELADLFGRPVDLVERGMVINPFRRRSIERDLTVLYAA